MPSPGTSKTRKQEKVLVSFLERSFFFSRYKQTLLNSKAVKA